MEIIEAIVHEIKKDAQSNDAELNSREEGRSPIDEKMQRLGEDVLKAYTKKSDSQGTFDSDTETYPFSERLREYHGGEKSLEDFSLSATSLILKEIKESFLATGGFAFFLKYRKNGSEWLLIIMLKLRPGTGIDPKSLELLPSLSFDISQLHEAARINLTKWTTGEQPYLSFIKKAQSKDNITLYFRSALGCTEYTDSRANTKAVIKALRDYCASKGLEPAERQAAEKSLHDYFDEKNNSDDKVVYLEALSSRVNDQEPLEFLEYLRENDVQASNAFTPSKTEYGKLQRITRKFGSVSVAFSVDDVANNVVDYDEDKGQLYIRDVPEALIQDIRKAKGYD